MESIKSLDIQNQQLVDELVFWTRRHRKDSSKAWKTWEIKKRDQESLENFIKCVQRLPIDEVNNVLEFIKQEE